MTMTNNDHTVNEGHKCYSGSCVNWVAFDDEDLCFEHTAPVSPGGCNCLGCKPPAPPRPTQFYCFKRLDGQCDELSVPLSIYCAKHRAEVHGVSESDLAADDMVMARIIVDVDAF